MLSHGTDKNFEHDSKILKKAFSPEYMVAQFSDRVEFSPQSSPSTLYSLQQRIPSVSSSYVNLSPGDDYPASAANEEWSRDRVPSETDTLKDNASDILSDKQSSECNTTNSVTGSVCGSSSGDYPNAHSPGLVVPACIYLISKIAFQMEMEDTPSVTADAICQCIINHEELGLNKATASQAFCLWMTSPLLELQLKPLHRPLEIRRCWQSLLDQYSHGSFNKMERDEPIVAFRRNVFFSQHVEEKLKDQKTLELLYEEAKQNILDGRYPCETAHIVMLGGIQARIELGAYNSQMHTIHYFREEQIKYLPAHVRKSPHWTWLPISSKNSAEVRLLEQFKRIPASATNRKLVRKYLEFCWTLPFYGAAFFEGQVEQPIKGIVSMLTHQDVPVLVAINWRGVYVIDDTQSTLLLGLKYEDLNWDHARPSKEDDPNCLPCLFLQFVVLENGRRVSKILQIFSRQASLMDRLISNFVQHTKRKIADEDAVDNSEANNAPMILNTGQPAPESVLSNKLDRLTLATFDEDGHLIGQMGSWSFSY